MSFYKTILQEALEIFQTHGIQALTEQSLIRKLNVSGATFHEMFDSKEDLLQQAVQYHLQQEQAQHKLIATAALNPAEELIGLLNYGVLQLRQINPLYFQDLIRDFPGIWELYLTSSQQHTVPRLVQVMEKGVEEGLFAANLNISIITRQLLGQINIIFDQALFPSAEFPLDEVYKTVYLHMIRGICTRKGLKAMKALSVVSSSKSIEAAATSETNEVTRSGLEEQ